jgi:Uri superfamily endonuclease
VYAYVGSAQRGLEKRIARHLGKCKKRFWHIDYLLCDQSVRVAEVFWKEAEKAEECATARKISEVSVPVVGFGCSDCSCKSHLFMLDSLSSKGGSMVTLTADFVRWVQTES